MRSMTVVSTITAANAMRSGMNSPICTGLVENWEPSLLIEQNATKLELHHQRVLVQLLVESMTDFIQHVEGAAQDLVRLILQQELGILSVMKVWCLIRVHPCLSVVEDCQGYFFRISAYSMLSVSAWRLASMMFPSQPTVPHSSLPSVDSMSTRVFAPVPVSVSRMRTL